MLLEIDKLPYDSRIEYVGPYIIDATIPTGSNISYSMENPNLETKQTNPTTNGKSTEETVD